MLSSDPKVNLNDHQFASAVAHLMPESSSCWPSSSGSLELSEKIDQVRRACEARDLDTIRKLAISADGLVNDSLRRTACRSDHVSPC